MARLVRCTIELELMEGRDFEALPSPEFLEIDALLFAAEEAFGNVIRDPDFEIWDYIQSKVIDEAT